MAPSADRDPFASDPGDNAAARASRHAAEDEADSAALRNRVIKAVGDSYEIQREVGRGGMAVVYAARDTRLKRTVALKVLPPDLAFRADVRARFVREAQTAARLNHPNIVPIYAVDERDGMVYFAMALVEGESLAQRLIREPRPPIGFVRSILSQVADALAYAHGASVVHRDVKPDNILVDRETGRAVVTDFGIARAAESGARLTQTGIAVGTPAFMSPEQATGDREIDGRSDVYSLGIVGYLMLAGRLPFEASTTPAMLVKHVSEPPQPLREFRPDAPRDLVMVLERCLAKKPGDRWPSAGALRDALRGELPPDQSYAQPRTTDNGLRDAHARDAEWQRRYPHGKRAEDWKPPVDNSPAPAWPQNPNRDQRDARQQNDARDQRDASRDEFGLSRMPNHPGMSPMPQMPPMPVGGSAREYREWRRAVRIQRDEAKRRWKAERHAMGLSASGASWAILTPEQQLRRFRGEVIRSVVMVGGLAMLNAATSPRFPWVIFPAFGMTMGLLSKYMRLRESGVRWSEIFSSDGKSVQTRDTTAPQDKPARITETVHKWRSSIKWTAGMAVAAGASFAIGAGLNADPMIVPFVGAILGGLFNLQRTIVHTFRLRDLGVSMRDAIGERWRERAATSDDRPRDVRLAHEADRLVGAAVMGSSLGPTVRAAFEDRMTIHETAAKLSDADRLMVPDVEPTADALLERVAAVASSLERLERDLPADVLTDLSVRIAAVEKEPEGAPDRDRRISLLMRQRASLQELVDRKASLQRQLESATLALRSLRLDLVKLRTLGVGALGDVTNATQEARALSKDIARALEAAEEVRRL